MSIESEFRLASEKILKTIDNTNITFDQTKIIFRTEMDRLLAAVIVEMEKEAGAVGPTNTAPAYGSILNHVGRKYLRTITSCVDGRQIQVDVYDVCEAFDVGRLPEPVGHMVKKLLCAGLRDKATALCDLQEAIYSSGPRAVEQMENRLHANDKADDGRVFTDVERIK